MAYEGWDQRRIGEERLRVARPERQVFNGHHAFPPDSGRAGHFEVFRLEAGNDLRGPSGGLAKGPGWFWWACEPGSPPHGDPNGPFVTAEAAYSEATGEVVPTLH
jgi:hypothetical protein